MNDFYALLLEDNLRPYLKGGNQSMPDYVLEEHLAAKLGLSPEELRSFEVQGVIHCEVKNGNTYYSSRDFYRLKGILHYMRNKGLSLQEARAKVGLATVLAN